MMTEEQLLWIEQHKAIFTSSVRMTPEQVQTVYDIYNQITGQKKKPNGCGRCFTTVKKRVLKEYLDLGNLF